MFHKLVVALAGSPFKLWELNSPGVMLGYSLPYLFLTDDDDGQLRKGKNVTGSKGGKGT